MADHPKWDFWVPNIHVSEDEDGAISITQTLLDSHQDIRADQFELNVSNWCTVKNFFWTAQQAALISFLRDPEAVNCTEAYMADDLDFGESSGEEAEKRFALVHAIDDLTDLIREAQDKGVLTQPMRREVYIEWALLNGIDIPQQVQDSVKDTWLRLSRAPQESVGAGSPRVTEGHQKRRANNLQKILLAALVEGNLMDRDVKDLAKKFDKFLKVKVEEEGDDDLKVSAKTIRDRINDAKDLLR
jgi:hypothetical protein